MAGSEESKKDLQKSNTSVPDDDSDRLSMIAAFQPGEKVLHYRILEPIAEGGMGEVYKATDLKLGRTVAIKVLPLRVARDPVARKRLFREARSASGLNHPNIVTIHAIEESESGCFIVMEYVEGRSLAFLILEGSLRLKGLLDIAIQIADAVGDAHKAGLIHRDIKPENIMVTKSGQVRLLDFGLAKRSVEGTLSLTNLTESGAISGTVCYMSPEQTHGQTLDHRTDIFSLGCVLYQAATGTLPFTGESALDILNAINYSEPPLPSSISSRLPQEFDFLIARCLAKDKERRYASAYELAADLRKLRVIIPDSERSKSSPGSSGRVPGKNRPPRSRPDVPKVPFGMDAAPAMKEERKTPTVLITVLITLALVGAGLYFWRSHATPRSRIESNNVSGTQATKKKKPVSTDETIAPTAVQQVPIQKVETAAPANNQVPLPPEAEAQQQQEQPGMSLPEPPGEEQFDQGEQPAEGHSPEGMTLRPGPPPHPPFFPARPGIVLLTGTTWRMDYDGEMYFHFTPEHSVYVKAPFMIESGICGHWQQNGTSVTMSFCDGSKWEGTRDGLRIEWDITKQDGSTLSTHSEVATSPVDW